MRYHGAMGLTLVIVGILVVAAALAWEFVPLQVTIWDGAFDLTVNASSTAGPLRSVRCKACMRREEAEFTLEHPSNPESIGGSILREPFDGNPISVIVPLSGRSSPSGRELRRTQYQFLVVVGNLQDGRQIAKLVEIPDCRLSREVSVSLP